MTKKHHEERGRIKIDGFDPDVVEQREPLSDWSGGVDGESRSRWRRAFHRFRVNRTAMIGMSVVAILSFFAIFARPIAISGVTVQPFSLAPYDPTATITSPVSDPYDPDVSSWDSPSWDYPLGIDGSGRDMLSRILTGGRYSISIGFVVVALTATFGMVYGSISGYYGGWVDEIMMRIVDTIYAFPGLVLAAIIVSLFGGGYWQLVLAFSLFGWNGYARVMRGEVLKVKQNEYVMAAKALGARDRTVIFKHVLPNAMAEVIVVATLAIGSVVIGVAALGFLGLGFDSSTPEWGTMLDDMQTSLTHTIGDDGVPWHATFFPGLAIFLFVMSMNMIGDGINDALDAQETGAEVGGGAQ